MQTQMCACVCAHIYVYTYICIHMGFPGGSVVKNPPAMQEPQETQVQSLCWEDPLEEGMETLSSILAWRIPMDREAWLATVHGSQSVGHD